jgi:ApaG protein
MFTCTTQGIKITALPIFLPDQSSPQDDHFVWAYTISIENLSKKTVKLINRSWIITDAGGQIQHVHGVGVIGEQPVLEAGFAYQYTSGTVLTTSSGIMGGAYEMMDVESGESFDVKIPTFSLDSPQERARPN